MNKENVIGLWEKHQKQWGLLSTPLRPAQQDLEIYNCNISDWAKNKREASSLAFVLGSTPEFATLNWPDKTRLYALDRSVNMLSYIWPDEGESCGRILMDWRSIPFENNTADFVIGDGSFNLLRWSDEIDRMLEKLTCFIKPHGRLSVRFFTRPKTAEPVEQVISDLHDNKIGNFHIFKWRFAMALLDKSPSIQVKDIWNIWHESAINEASISTKLHWPIEVINTIHAYRDSDQLLTFPLEDELLALLEKYFLIKDLRTPDYELGDRCPIITMQPLPR